MTHEQTARIVKVCERIGWPKSSTNFLEWDKLACGWYWYGQPLTRQMSYAEDNAEAILEKHLRQWLKKHWDEVESHCAHGVVALELVRYNPPGESCYCAEVAINTEGETDELELCLTAVERTLEQENKI